MPQFQLEAQVLFFSIRLNGSLASDSFPSTLLSWHILNRIIVSVYYLALFCSKLVTETLMYCYNNGDLAWHRPLQSTVVYTYRLLFLQSLSVTI